jgi:N utilization substance protein B
MSKPLIDLKDLIKFPSEVIDEADQEVAARTLSRRAALQALYQWHFNQDESYLIEKQFMLDGLLTGCDRDWFKELLNEVTKQADALDRCYEPFLDRSIKMINPVERNILRLACYEFQAHMQIPYKVVINEAVELTKRFGAEDAHKYINGVLDRVAKQMRPLEFASN